jgi:hypothetical protein
MRLLYIALLFLVSCAKVNDSRQTESVSAQFNAKYETYKALVSDFDSTNCDWLLFQSLRDASVSRTGLVEQAEGEPGRWYRTPLHDCFPSGRSKSDISRDMLLGLAVYLWQMGDAANAQEVIDYARDHDGVMGDGDVFRTDIRTPLLTTYKAITLRIKDSSIPLPPATENPDPNAPSDLGLDDSLDATLLLTDYRAHLAVLHIYLRGIIYGAISDFDRTMLRKQTERAPRNAFFQAVFHKFSDGNQTAAIDVLLDESLFPKDSLPTNAEFCTPYLWERDPNENWEPCETPKTHTGADFLFVAEIIRNGFREGTP